MTNQIKIFFDMIAGILAGMEILVPRVTYKQIDAYLLGQLKGNITRKGSLSWLWMVGAIILTIGVILALEFSPVTKDINNGHIFETIILIIGFLVGMIALALITRFYKSIKSLRNVKPTDFAFGASLFIGIAAWSIGVILSTHHFVTAVTFLIAFSASITIMGILVGIMPLAQKFLTFQSGVLLRIGVILFIVARIIELKNS